MNSNTFIKNNSLIVRLMKHQLAWTTKVNDSLWQESNIFGIGLFWPG